MGMAGERGVIVGSRESNHQAQLVHTTCAIVCQLSRRPCSGGAPRASARTCVHTSAGTVALAEMRTMCVSWCALGGTVVHKNLKRFL